MCKDFGFELVFVAILYAVGLAACGVSALRERPEAGSGGAGSTGAGVGGSQSAAAGGASGVHDAAGMDQLPDAGGQPDTSSGDSGDASDARGETAGDARDEVPADAVSEARADAIASTCSSCTSWGQPAAVGPSPSALVELSGLAASHAHPGILYGHNDSGDTARFFALTELAHVDAELHLMGDPTATDWEDVSVGPCPAGSCVYIGDTGDNDINRTQYVIHRVVEPATLPTDGSVVTVSYESFPFVYPQNQSHNAETLLVHPVTGQVFIIIKETGIAATVYEMPLPLQAGQQVTLTKIASLTVPVADGVVTDGSFHPCGDRLLIRTTSTTGLFELTRGAGQSLTALFTATPVMVPVAVEPQGESVTYAPDGRRYFTGSETVKNMPVPNISVVTCQD